MVRGEVQVSGVAEIAKLGKYVEPKTAFIVADKTALTNDETIIRARVNAFFGQVDTYDDADIDAGNADLEKYDLVIVSQTCVDVNVNELTILAVPVISLKGSISDDILGIGGTNGTDAADNQTNVTDITHNITRGEVVGALQIYGAASPIDFIGTLGAGALSLSEDTVTATEEHLVVVPEEGILQTGAPASDTRIHFGFYDVNQWNNNGRTLFDECVNYAIYGRSGIVNITATIDSIAEGPRQFGIFGDKAPPLGISLGNAYFVDAGVAASGDGTNWASAVQTIQEAMALVATDQDDVVFVAPGAYDEDALITGVTVAIAGIHIIGIGLYQCTVENSNVGATAVFTVTADYVEIAGFSITEATATVEGIYSTADYCWFHDMVLRNAMENCIHLDGSIYTLVERNWIQSPTNDGIELSGISAYNIILNNFILNAGDNGIHLNGDDVDTNDVYKNRINGVDGGTDTGINIVLGDRNFISNNWIGECVAPKADTGTANVWIENPTIDDVFPDAGTYNHANVITEETALTLTIARPERINSILLDLVNLTQNATIRIKVEVDGANLRTIDTLNWTVAMDDGVLLTGFVTETDVTVTIQSAVLEGAIRAIPYRVL